MTVENLSNEQIKEIAKKIKKLLALSKSDNENEAMLALQKAQELQAKYNVVFDQISLEEDSQQVIEERYESPDTKSFNSLFSMIASALADHYRVKLYINVKGTHTVVDGKLKFGTKKELAVVGLPFDVEVYKQSLFFAYGALRKCADRFVKKLPDYYTRSQKSHSKNDYCFGFIHGCVKGLKDNEMSKALVIRTPEAVVKYMENLFLRKGKSSGRAGRGDMGAYAAGHRDGVDSMKSNGKRLLE